MNSNNFSEFFNKFEGKEEKKTVHKSSYYWTLNMGRGIWKLYERKGEIKFCFRWFPNNNVRYFNIAFMFVGVRPHGTHKTFIFPYFCGWLFVEEKYFFDVFDILDDIWNYLCSFIASLAFIV